MDTDDKHTTESLTESSTWSTLEAGLNLLGLLFPPWAAVVLLILLVVLLVALIWVCWKAWHTEPVVTKKAKAAAKVPKVKPLDTSHLMEYPGSIYSSGVQPDGSEMDLDHHSHCSVFHEKRFLGTMKYSLKYDTPKGELTVAIHQAVDLHLAIPGEAIHPYCKVYLYPSEEEKKICFETSVASWSSDPVFNQAFTFRLPFSELLDKTLIIVVLNSMGSGKAAVIGEVRIPIGSLDTNRPVMEEWRDLEMARDVDDSASHGDMCVSIRYVPTTTKLTVVVLECKNLRRKTNTAPIVCDPFVKLKLKHGDTMVKNKRTSVKKRTCNPYFNEEFIFLVSPDKIHKSELILTICLYEGLMGARKIGKVVLSAHAVGSGSQHWNDMVSSPRRPIVQWHRLEPMH